MEVFIKIFGLVQGVNFRYYTREQARKFTLTGCVKNAPDGTVEIVAQGQPENLEKFISWCRKGPNFAEVAKVELNWRKPETRFSNFEIKY